MKNKGGRPPKFQDKFYMSIYKQNEEFSYTELCKQYNVSRSTITRWIRRGKELTNGQTKS